MDNVNIHKTIEFNNSDEAFRLRAIFLPQYSPVLDSIENVFSKWKYIIRTLNPTTNEILINSINVGSKKITPDDCQRYFTKILRCLADSIEEKPIDK